MEYKVLGIMATALTIAIWFGLIKFAIDFDTIYLIPCISSFIEVL